MMVRQMNNITLYTYTSDRLKEFNNEKSEDDIIVSPQILSDSNRIEELEDETKKIYFDITSLYKSTQERPIEVENVLYQISKKNNWHIIINYNSSSRFKDDFGQYISDIIPINNIYMKDNDYISEFSSLTEEHLNLVEKNLNEKLYGHSEFKKEFIRQIRNFSVLHKLGEIKIFSLLICGESGIGKTELARILHETVYRNSSFIKINLGNYNTQGALNSLIGSPKGFFGSERGGELSNKIKNSDSKIILIDEFEKADNDIFNFFYELLEDGKFTDLSENEYNLNGYLIIFTTNLNNNNYKKEIPSPLLSRFTMKSLFEQMTIEDKNKYIEDRTNKLVEKYNTIFKGNIERRNVIKKIDINSIKSISNFRYLNLLIQKALIEVVEESKKQ